MSLTQKVGRYVQLAGFRFMSKSAKQHRRTREISMFSDHVQPERNDYGGHRDFQQQAADKGLDHHSETGQPLLIRPQ